MLFAVKLDITEYTLNPIPKCLDIIEFSIALFGKDCGIVVLVVFCNIRFLKAAIQSGSVGLLLQ